MSREIKEQFKHIAFFYYSYEDWQKSLIPLIKKVLESGEKIIYFSDKHTSEQIINLLDIDSKDEKSQIIFLNKIEPDMIEKLVEVAEKAISDGFKSLFITIDMTWALQQRLEKIIGLKQSL
ncbi:MAG: MEDS domain-containing protein [Thermodesulfovibrio sp.]|nr:MEDS domain-containing protein [Thermodesulfovibrio sp.]